MTGLLLCFLLGLLPSTASAPAYPGTAPVEIRREPLFDGPVLHWEVQVRRADLEKLRKSGGPWNRENDSDASATVRAGGQVWTNVAIHLKGAAGSFRPVDDLPALTLNFGKFQDGQTCGGHRKLHLNNSVQDASRLDEILASEMFLQSGLPTPRATRALVSLNGRYLGIYVLKGGWDKAFLKQHFESSKGNFYDPGFLKDLDINLERDSGEGAPDWSDLIALRQSLAVQDPAERLQRVSRHLDIDRITTLGALQILLDDWDGYLRNRNNYRVYHVPSSDLLVLMPHGMDQLWRSPRGSFTPPLSSLLGQRLFSIPIMADRLTHRMRELTNTVFRPQFVDGVFSNAQSRLRERLILEGREAELPPVQRAVDSTLQRTRQRMAAFAGQRYQPPQPGEFDNEGRMHLTEWSSPSPEQEGPVTPIAADEGSSVFRITASAAEGRTSLQKRILLAPGLYQWEARVRTRSVSGFGACLDVEWGRRGQRFDEGSTPLQSVTGTADWTLLKRDILIPARGEGGRRRPGGPMGDNGSSPREILLHAELRADSGTAEFDADAFVLRKR
ncbi:MAG: CotH kinase family protein [Verrucomicrobia bacterium]|nr:CotH kinase family protein [Verrucomicrobiota bacterium]